MKEALKKNTTQALLLQYVAIMDELKERKIIRSNNNITGDYAEWVVKKALDLPELPSQSTKGYDAEDLKGIKYQIKGRRITTKNSSRQLGAFRDIEEKNFDFLIGVIFDEDYNFSEAYKIPHSIIKKYSKHNKHVNGHIMHLKGPILSEIGVERIDEQIRRTIKSIG